MGNAIKYNYNGGKIEIKISGNNFSIANTSKENPIKSENLFNRLNNRNLDKEQSNGLGLAIVKKIIDTNHLFIAYTGNNGIHRFTISKT